MKKLALLVLPIMLSVSSLGVAQVIPNNEFSSNLEGWYGMFDAWYSASSNIGEVAWSSNYGGSAYLRVSGAPSVIGIWTQTQGTISPGDSVYYRVYHSNFGNFAGIQLNIGGLPPHGQTTGAHQAPAGTYNLSIIADRTYPGGTPIWIKLAAWPGDAEAYVHYVKTNATKVEEDTYIPADNLLLQNRPNPMRSGTNIGFEVKKDCHVILRIYDTAGKLIRTLLDGKVNADKHQIMWNGMNAEGQRVRKGTYFYRLDVDGKNVTKKAIIGE